MKKLLMFLIVCMVMVTGSVAFAAEPDQTYAKSELYVNGRARVAGQITLAQASISSGTKSINCTAKTTASKSSDKIGAYFVIQKWNGSSWATYKTGSDYVQNKPSYSASKTFSAVAGKYRVVAYHRTYNGSALFSEVERTTGSVTVG